jgi:hypothetical protein
MGNDIDVLSQDEELDSTFWRLHGPKNESTLQFFRRSFDSFCNSISSPKRSLYSSSDLQRIPFGYVIREFDISSQGIRLHCCRWMLESSTGTESAAASASSASSKRCVVYLHTNTRNISDAVEVFPFCVEINAHLLAFDLPGAGQSEGKLSTNMTGYLDNFMECIYSFLGNDAEVILWARGMSTAIAIEYCAKAHKRQSSSSRLSAIPSHPRVSLVILDTPFESIKLMVDACVAKLSASGHEIPTALVSMFSMFAKRIISNQLQGDPYAITPMQYVKELELPCMVIANMNDDYVPIEQQIHIAEAW